MRRRSRWGHRDEYEVARKTRASEEGRRRREDENEKEKDHEKENEEREKKVYQTN